MDAGVVPRLVELLSSNEITCVVSQFFYICQRGVAISLHSYSSGFISQNSTRMGPVMNVSICWLYRGSEQFFFYRGVLLPLKEDFPPYLPHPNIITPPSHLPPLSVFLK